MVNHEVRPSAGTEPIGSGHRAMTESPFFFVFVASVPKNEQDRRGPSIGRAMIGVLYHTSRLLPERTLCLFFFLYAQKTQVSEGKEHEGSEGS
jgi:hypothetical protein